MLLQRFTTELNWKRTAKYVAKVVILIDFSMWIMNNVKIVVILMYFGTMYLRRRKKPTQSYIQIQAYFVFSLVLEIVLKIHTHKNIEKLYIYIYYLVIVSPLIVSFRSRTL